MSIHYVNRNKQHANTITNLVAKEKKTIFHIRKCFGAVAECHDALTGNTSKVDKRVLHNDK